MNQELTIIRLRELAGIKESEEVVAVLLPRKPADDMKDLLGKLKDIWNIPQDQNLTAVDLNGEKYIATGVKRDL